MFDELFPIEDEILGKLNEVAKECYAAAVGDRDWTLEFKKALRDLGESHGFQVWSSLGDKSSSEWLWDLCWANCPEDKRGNLRAGENLRAIELACEIEWKQHDEWTLEDFLKLTVCNAAHRLFVFTAAATRLDDQFRRLMKACPGSRGFRYLAVGVPNNPVETLPYRAWTL